MLSLNGNSREQPISIEDQRILALAKTVILLGEAMESLIPEMSDSPLNYMPRLYEARGCDLDDDSMLFTFTYKKNNRFYSFELPVFANLDKVSPNPSNNNKESFVENRPRSDSSYTRKIIKMLQYPFVMLSAGFGSVANLFNIALKLHKIKLSGLVGISTNGMVFNLIGIGASLLYFIPTVFYYYNNARLKNELLVILNDSMNDILHDDCVLAHNKLKNLTFFHRILLHPNYPDNNDDIRWSYYYQKDLINEKCDNFKHCRSYKKALELSNTSDQKFLVLHGLINVYDWCYEHSVKRFNNLYYLNQTEEARNAVKNSKTRNYATIDQYALQIPENSSFHLGLQKTLHSQLQQCVDSIRNNNNALAKSIFDDINFNGYCKRAYPAAAILYYQLQTVLTLCMERYEPFDMESTSPIQRLAIARENLSKVQEYIDKYYHGTEISQQHKKYIDLFNASTAARETAYVDPISANYIAPVLFSELEPALQDITELESSAECNIKNSFPSRSQSPNYYA